MESLIPILIPGTFVAMLVIERVWPGRDQPRVRGWLVKGLVFFTLAAVLNAIVPAVITGAIAGHAPLDLSRLGTVAGGLIGFLISDVAAYAVHRTLHNVPVLWRWTHQMHHSAERVDIAGGAYFHPFDFVVQIAVVTLAIAPLGITPDAAALAGYVAFVVGMFQHLNVRTPVWLGWIIQRPEAHAIHHARGVHAYNYGNVMLWDIVLGTFRNPTTFTEPAGFWDGASRQLLPMLFGRDVSTTTTKEDLQ